MKLYYVPGSPNCRKVHAVINHLGIDVDFEYLDFLAGDLKKPEFLALNPNAMVPVLVDGDLRLTESNAIMQYLADDADNTLFPKDPKLRADVVRWQCWELAHYNKALGVASFELVIKPNFFNQDANQALVDWGRSELQRFAPVLDSALQGREWLVGNTLTLADYSVAHTEMFADAVGFDWNPYANILAWYERMRAIPHWASTAVSPEQMGRLPATEKI